MPDFTEISRKVICCSLNSQNHLPALIHKAYLRYLKAISVKNVTNGHFCSITCSAEKPYKPLMATVQTYGPTDTIDITIQDIHKKIVASPKPAWLPLLVQFSL